jgi:hypothetical protein
MPKGPQNLPPNPYESNSEARGDGACLQATGDVVERLQGLGLQATIGSIARDTREHYLPPRDTRHTGRGGNSGLWEPWMVRRAERLYRLRALNRRTKRGPTGDLLRTLLLIHDGWGFEYVKGTCIEGYRRLAHGATRGVDNRVRSEPLTIDNVPFYAEDVAADQYRPKEPTNEQIQRIEFTLNTVLFGVDTGTGMGTLGTMMDDLARGDVEPAEMNLFRQAGSILHSMMGLSVDEVITRAENIEARTMLTATREFRKNMYFVRRMFHRKFGSARRGGPPSSNPLSMFGGGAQVRLGDIFRKAPVRITPAQFLGGEFLINLAAVRRMEELAQWATGMVPFLPAIMQAALSQQAAAGTTDKVP